MRRRSNAFQRSVAIVASVAMLAGCTTQAGRIGTDDGSDPCRAQLVALDTTGNYFAEDIIRGAAIGAVGGAILGGLIGAASGGGSRAALTGAAVGGVAGGAVGAASGYYAARQRQAQNDANLLRNTVASDLAKENEELDRTQLAFNQLMDCRFAVRNRIIADARAGRIARPQANAQLAELRGRVQNDVAVAQRINERIGRRGGEFDVAIDSVAPEARRQADATRATRSRSQNITVAQPIVLRVRPDQNAPEITRVSARQTVSVQPAEGNFARVQTSDGMVGYVPASSVGTRGLGTRAAAATPQGGDVRQLASSNIARRDAFNESIETAQRLAQAQSGFEVS